MKRASYKEGIEWIACNDNDGAPEPYDVEDISGYISVGLLAVLFDTEPDAVARDVVKFRKKHAVSE